MNKVYLKTLFTNPVCEAFASVMHHHRKSAQPQKQRDISRTVGMLKQYLYDKLIFKGASGGPLQRPFWEILLEPATTSLISSSLNGRKTPWAKAYEAMVPPPSSQKEGYDSFCRRHLDSRVTWIYGHDPPSKQHRRARIPRLHHQRLVTADGVSESGI